VLAIEGPPLIEGDLPARFDQLAISSGPYELIEYEVVARPRSLLQTHITVSGGNLIVDGDGPMIAYEISMAGRSMIVPYDLRNGLPREPAKGAPVYPSWELVRIDDEGQVRVLVSFD